MTEEEYEASQAEIGPAALQLYHYWQEQRDAESKTLH